MNKKISIFIILIFISILLIFFKYVNDCNILSNKKQIDDFINLKNTKKRTPNMILELAENYYNGIDEKITPKGIKQKGIKKNEYLAIKYYSQLLKLKDNKIKDIAIFRIAEIYLNSEKYKNLRKSKKFFIMLTNSCYKDLQLIAFEKIQYINTILKLPILDGLIYEDSNNNYNNNYNNCNNYSKEETKYIPKIRNDSQNTHDTTVVKCIRKNIENIKKDSNFVNEEEYKKSYEKLKDIIKNCNKTSGNKFKISKEKINKAINTLDIMYNQNNYIEPLKLNERDSINIVYNKINKYDENEFQNFSNNIVLQLSDSSINTCGQGRVSRIISTIDTEQTIKPLWVLKQEMMNKAPILRKQLLEKENLNEEIINNPKTLTEKQISDIFEKQFKCILKNTFENDYVKNGMISKESLEKELNSWI